MKQIEYKKISLALSQKSLNDVDYISTVVGEKNKTRCIAISLKIARNILEHISNKDEIIFRDENGNEKTMSLIIS